MQPTAHQFRRIGRPMARARPRWALGLCAMLAALQGAPLQSAEAAAAPAPAEAPRAQAGPGRPADKAPGKAAPAGPLVAVAPAGLPASEDDPMERLRQRLGERLTTAKPADHATGPLEVRVLARSPASAHAARSPSGGRAGHGKGAAKAHAAHAPHWSYAGPAGPQTWGGLKPDFALCANGQRQSPIDIQGGLSVELEPVHFSYKASRFGVVDNGHTVQANLAEGNFIEVGGRRFALKQFHFHRPSEERIDGRQFEMSLHLVHQDEQGRLAVVALLLDRGSPHPAVQKVWNSLPLEKQEELPSRALLDLAELLPHDHGYYTYMGSLTTPPCSEGVQWIVMRQPVSVSGAQIELFARLYPMNARPLQNVAGRRILQSQ